FGEAVLVPHRPLLIRLGRDQARLDQPIQAITQCVAGYPQTGHELVEASHAQKEVTEHEDGPGVAEYLHRVGDGTSQAGERFADHGFSVVSFRLQPSAERW